MKRKQTPPKAPGASGKQQPKKTGRADKKKVVAQAGNEKHPGGRPTKYEARYEEDVFKLCLLGATDREIAAFFNVTEQTVNNWKGEHPEFFESISRGKERADAEVANSLYQRALGYSHQAVKIMQDKGYPVVVPYIEHYPPDTPAASLWLRNRQPKKWRDKVELVGGSDPNDPPVTVAVINHEEAMRRLEGKFRDILGPHVPASASAG